MPDTTSNILITTNDNTAIIATDYGTSGIGFTAAHTSISKIAYGDDITTTRVSTANPLPVFFYGSTAMTNTITGTVGGTGTFYIRNVPTTYIEIAGTTFSSTKIGITGTIEGKINGYPVGISGPVSIHNTVNIQGITNGVLVGITGGRNLTSAADSVSVVGSVTLSGLTLSAATHSISVYGADLGTKVLTKIYSSDGTTLGTVSDALKVHVANSGVTFAVNISATVGVTNADGSLGLRIQGTGITASNPVIIQGTAPNGAIEVVSYEALAVTVDNEVDVNDTAIIESLELASKPLISNLTSIRTNTNSISLINDRLNNGTLQAKITEISRSNLVVHGKKTATTTPSVITTVASSLKTGINIKASTRNTDMVYIGNSKLLSSPDDGYPLDPGESLFIECNSTTLVYVKSGSGSQLVHYIAS